MKIVNFLLIFIIIIGIGALVFWLWQRQPKGIDQRKPETTSTTVENKQSENNASILVLSPKDGDILDSSNINFSGKTNKVNKIIFISNSANDIASVKNDGTFEITETLDNGLNLITVVSIDRDFKEIQKQSLTLYVPTKSTKDNIVIAGLVNKIFENTLTVTTLGGDVTINKTDTATITAPKPDTNKPASSPKASDIRIGDYVVAFGTKTQDTQVTASSIQVIRDNKPQITKKYVSVKLASAAKLKIFSGYNLVDNKLIEFKLDKINVIDNDKKSDEKAIIKDKRAIVFYTSTGSDNIVSLIYILP